MVSKSEVSVGPLSDTKSALGGYDAMRLLDCTYMQTQHR